MSARNLINKYAVKEDTFTIDLCTKNIETGQNEVDTLTVRQIKDTRELTEMNRAATKFFEMLTNKLAAPPLPFRPFLPVDEKTAEMVYMVSTLVLDPPISQIEALEMARDAGPLMARINGEIMGRNVGAAGIAERDVIEEAKKNFLLALSTGNTSSSDEIACESTRNDGMLMTGDTPASIGQPA